MKTRSNKSKAQNFEIIIIIYRPLGPGFGEILHEVIIQKHDINYARNIKRFLPGRPFEAQLMEQTYLFNWTT
jgi:hypothetical protein